MDNETAILAGFLNLLRLISSPGQSLSNGLKNLTWFATVAMLPNFAGQHQNMFL
jgi:hypothetical protein